jgi:glucosamine-6-phosphate deaminase
VPAASVAQDPSRYDEQISAAGGVGLQLLGIGGNGHIGFNEPGSPLDGGTRLITLDERTRQDNARFFPSLAQVPTRAVTQGIGTIMRARRLVLLAFGQQKAAPLAAALAGPVTPRVPASAVQHHPDVIVLADADAASLLPA